MNANDASWDDELRQAFDTWAPSYEADASAKLVSRGYSYDELGASVAAVVRSSDSGGPVLEVGTGTGVLGQEVVRRLPSIELSGLDISPQMLARAGAKNVYTRLELAAADEFDYSRGYAVIYSSFVFHSIADQAGFLERARSGLFEDGKLVIVDLFPGRLQSAQAGMEHSRLHEKGAPANYVEVGAFQRLVNIAGFRILESRNLGQEREYTHVWHLLSR